MYLHVFFYNFRWANEYSLIPESEYKEYSAENQNCDLETLKSFQPKYKIYN